MRLKHLILVLLFFTPVVFKHSSNISYGLELSEPIEVTEVPRSKFAFSIVKKEAELNYVTHSPITILSDDDFGNYSFPGLGTNTEPYIITNLNITTSNTSAIFIANTTRSFIITSCFLSAINFGIYLFNVSTEICLIESNNCTANIFGIWGKYTNDIQIMNNTCSNNDMNGILLKECHGCIVEENTIEWNSDVGIYLENCMGSQLEDNIVIENGRWGGIQIRYSNNSRVNGNICINNRYTGIYCQSSNGSIIEQNYAYSNNGWNGIVVTNSYSVTVLNNSAISSISSLTVHLSPEITIVQNNLFITGLYLSDDYYENYLEYEIHDNFVNDYKLGFFLGLKRTDLTEPIYGQVIIVNGYKIGIRNQLSTPDFCGVTLFNCKKIIISDFKLIAYNHTTRYAIKIVSSRDVEVSNIICKNWRVGIRVYKSEHIVIRSNLVENSRYSGIMVLHSNSISLINNTIIENTGGGIVFYNSDECEISYNNIVRNNRYYEPGLRLDSSDHNIIHHNNFLENDLDGSDQAMDFGDTENTWFEESSREGNFYSDWSGSGPYSIKSWTNVTDPYPLSEPAVYTEPNYFAIYFSVILIFPIVVTVVIQLRTRSKNLSRI